MLGGEGHEAERVFPGDGEMAGRMRAFDWSRSAAGPVSAWPESLKTAVRILLHSRFPMFLWWGRRALTYLYNDAYVPVLGDKHPGALGRSGAEVWPEIWDTLGPFCETVFEERRSNWSEALPLAMERHGYREETFFTFSYSPIVEGDGRVGGLFCACTEDTLRVVGERRLRTQRELAGEMAAARTLGEACSAVSSCLAANPDDVPFALLLLADDAGERARLVVSTGLGSDTSPAATEIDLRGGDAADVWDLAEVARTRASRRTGDLARAFVGPVPRGSWPDPPREAFVVPLPRPGHDALAGFLVLGISPRRPFDASHRDFFELLAGHVATGLSGARAYTEARRRAEALAELDRAKTAFFGNVSHEFRTPLTLMLAPLEALRGANLPPEAQRHVELLQRSSTRLLKLVNALLDFSRIEAGRVEASYEPTDLARLTSELASVFRSTMERGGLRFEVLCAPLSEAFYVDRTMWEKVVLNLLLNAFKFTLEGEVAVELSERTGGAELVVRDTGCGIPEAALPRIFERFHRVAETRGRTFEGSGIGLALVQELVRLHGGTIGVESAPGRGTTFRVWIPCGAAHLPPERVRPSAAAPELLVHPLGAMPYVEEASRWLAGEDAFPEQPADAVPGARPATAGSRVLVADDNADMRDYLRRLLGSQWQVETVADGEAALAAIRSRRPDLLLTDVMMPRLDGFGLMRAVRADPATRTLPIILLSARAGEEARVEGMDAGADDYLVKPFSARELVARVGAQLELARIRDEALRERERLLEDARRARSEAESASRAKDEFLAMLGHELRNPLSAVRNGLATARRDPERREEALAIALRQAEQLGWLVDDLLDVARITHGLIALRRERCSLGAIVTRAIEATRSLADAGRHELVLRTPDDAPWVEGDPARLEQIAVNLLSNAFKYTGPGGRVEVDVAREGAHARLTVRDSGIGIAPDLLPRVFELFTQGERSPERAAGGLGIGLTVARRLVHLHGGSIRAHSDGLGHGAEFVVHLPALEAGAPAAERPAPPPPPAGRKAGRKAARVLVVEDNRDAAESLRLLLEVLGHRVQVAHDGVSALEAARAIRPELMLVDIGLPRMDGYEVARGVRGDPALAGTSLVALTGYGRAEDRVDAVAAGFDHHLVKPVDPAVLERLVLHIAGAGSGEDGASTH